MAVVTLLRVFLDKSKTLSRNSTLERRPIAEKACTRLTRSFFLELLTVIALDIRKFCKL